MSQAVVNSPQGLLGVQFLGFKQFLHKLSIEHGGNDVIQNCRDKRESSYGKKVLEEALFRNACWV
jgi:hypothetical protein